MPATYEPIATTTLGSASASVTFSSISGSFTDLILVYATTSTVTDNNGLRFNSDTGSNYSLTRIFGNGSTAGSNRTTNSTSITSLFTVNGSITNNIIHIMNYSNTTTYKSVLTRNDDASNSAIAAVGLWRSTSAINSVNIFPLSGNFVSGSTFTLYGILSA
jgi:hypothetical protein